MKTLTDSFTQTRRKLASLRPLSYAKIAADLGLPYAAVGMLSDVCRGRFEHVSQESLDDLRQRLELPDTPTRPDTWTLRLPGEWRQYMTPAEAREILALAIEYITSPDVEEIAP